MKKYLLIMLMVLMMNIIGCSDFQDGVEALEEKNFEQSFKEWLPLAEKGLAKAQYNIGLLYDKGLGVEQDYFEAANWYKAAAKQGDPRAQYHLGLLYFWGKGVRDDHEEAGRWFLKAAEQNLARAQYNVNIMYNESMGLPLNYSKSYQWYHKAVQNGFKKGKNDLDVHGMTKTRENFYHTLE